MIIGDQTALHAARLAGALHATCDAIDLDFSRLLTDNEIHASIEKLCGKITGRLPDYYVSDPLIREAFLGAYVADLEELAAEIAGRDISGESRYDVADRARLADLRIGIAAVHADLARMGSALETKPFEPSTETIEATRALRAALDAEARENLDERLDERLDDGFDYDADDLKQLRRRARSEAVEALVEVERDDVKRAQEALAALGTYAAETLHRHNDPEVFETVRAALGEELARYGEAFAALCSDLAQKRAAHGAAWDAANQGWRP